MPDRYSDAQPASCRNPKCTRGWLEDDDEGRRVPCLDCKPHLASRRSEVHDYDPDRLSAAARAAHEKADRE